MSPTVSVVVLAWNNEDVIETCLDSIAQLELKPLEVVVVDNGSVDRTPEILRSRGDITVVTLPKNRGFAGGQVAAEPFVHGDFVALVNSDAVLSPSWLSELVAEMEDDVAVAGGRAYEWDGSAHERPREAFYSYQVIDPVTGGAETMRAGDDPIDVNSISGAAVLIRTSALREVGGFDARFFCYYEETDLFARMRRAGGRIRYVPRAEVWHQIRASSRSNPGFYEFYMFRNRTLCALKNFDRDFLLPFLARFFREVWSRVRRRGLSGRTVLRAILQLLLLTPHILLARRRLPRDTSYNRSLVQDPAPVVTVAVTCFNHERYVGEAIASALAQEGHTVAEVVVVDDGSTDGSWGVIESFGDRVRAVRQRNGGVVAARNKALEMTTTEWIVFLDSDDVLPPDYVRQLLMVARLRALDVAYGDARYFGAKTGLLEAEPFDRFALGDHNFIHCSALLRRSHVQAVGGFKDEMRAGYEDWELYMSLFEHGSRFAYVPGVELGYRQHPQMESRNARAAQEELALRQQVARLHPGLYAAPRVHWIKRTIVWRVLRVLLGPTRRRLRQAMLR